MAAEFDVAGRLVEGSAALDDTQTYVSAAAARGYRHPDLTVHSVQVRDWYATEDGLDLRALDADCVVLRAAAQAASEASRCVRTQLSAVTAAWEGEGAGAAIGFLSRHSDRAEQVAAAVEAAARSCERLRDELWRIVDGKVDAVVSLDVRTGAQRPAWLTAARTVIAGEPVSEDAGSVVDSEITPFVATAVSGEWLPVMRAAVSAVAVAYRAAVEGVASRPAVRFDIPGNLAPAGDPRVAPVAVATPASAPAVPAPVVPAAVAPWSDSPSTAFEPASTAFEPAPASPAAVPSSPPPTVPPPAALAAPPPMPTTSPATLGEPASALGGLPGRFADPLGGLFGGGTPAPDGIPGLSGPGPVEPMDLDPGLEPDLEPEDDAVPEEESVDEETSDDAGDEDGEVEVEAEVPEQEAPAETEEPDCPAAAEPEPVTPEPVASEPVTPEPVTPEPVAPVPAPGPAADPSATPCEIAADELPQVGQ